MHKKHLSNQSVPHFSHGLIVAHEASASLRYHDTQAISASRLLQETSVPEAQASAAFISYCREDSEFALRLAQNLKDAGASVWIDQLDIAAGQLWDNAIEDALIASPRMLLILSPGSARSNNVRNEISFALEQGKTIIPVLYRDCTVPLQLQRANRIDFRADYTRGLAALLAGLNISQPKSEVLHDAAEAEAKRKAAWQAREAEARRLQQVEDERQREQADRQAREAEARRSRQAELDAQQTETDRIFRQAAILRHAEAPSVVPSSQAHVDAEARPEREPDSTLMKPWYKRTIIRLALAGTSIGLLAVVIVLTHKSRRAPSEPSSSKSTATAQQSTPPNTPELKPQAATEPLGATPQSLALPNGSAVGQSSPENRPVETDLQSKWQTIHSELQEMIRRKQYRQAIPIAKEACTKGDLRSCVDAGDIYEGLKDDSKAVGVYRTACDGGEPHGCENLAIMYANGSGGLPQDTAKQVALLDKACDGEDMQACAALGVGYLQSGVGANIGSQAVPYLRKACTGGESQACGFLGGLYEQGQGELPRDYKLAAPLLQRAADSAQKSCNRESKTFYTGSCFEVGRLYLHPSMQDYAKAIGFFRKACDLEGVCFPLADMYMDGRGVARNTQEAISILRSACESKVRGNCFALARNYEQGWGGIQDKAQAHTYYLKECALPNPSMTKEYCDSVKNQSTEAAAK